MDEEMEMRVWERVSGQAEVPDLRGMELRCRESAAVMHILAGRASGDLRERLLRLRQEIQEDGMTLRGLRIMAGEEPEKLPRYEAGRIGFRRGLAQVFQTSRLCHMDFIAGCRNEALAPVFQVLAGREARRMRTLLALIGEEKSGM